MPQLSAMSRILVKLTKNTNFLKFHDYRFYSVRPIAKKRHARSVQWSINGTNTEYSSVNAVLTVSNTKIAFNCGEGLQRIIHKGQLPSIEHIFITRLDWRCVAGLHGALLMLYTCGAKRASVFGPATLNHLRDKILNNIPKEELDVTVVDCENGHIYVDDALRLRAIPLRNPSEPYARVFAYAAEIEGYRSGAINIEKCVDLDVPAGPMIIQLSKGLDVTLDNGTVVRSADVTNFYPKLNSLVVDIPNTDYLHHLENPEILLNESEAENSVLHFSPSNIIATNEYQKYMRKFPPGTMHITTNDNCTFSGHIQPHKEQIQLNHISGHIFPMLEEKIDSVHKYKDDSTEWCGNDIRIESMIPNRIFKLRPIKSIEDYLELEPKVWLKALTGCEELRKPIERFRTLQKDHIANHPISERAKEYPKIVFLGTGAGCPKRARNVSGILVHLSQNESILLDCGEGTLGQLYRLYGNRTPDLLRNLKAIYISHMHLDHFMGLFNLLRQVKEVKSAMTAQQPVAIMGPIALNKRLGLFNYAIQDLSGSYNFICNNRLMGEQRTNDEDQLICATGLMNIKTCYVDHICDAFGVTLSVRRSVDDSEFKLTYSGDTMPCQALIELGKGSAVLIHEATSEDDLAEAALARKHSTVSQAVNQAAKMNAKYTILTHFSQRSRFPRLKRPLPHNVLLAIDNMELVESDIKLAPHLYEVLRNIHQDEMDEYEQKTEKRKLRKERFGCK